MKKLLPFIILVFGLFITPLIAQEYEIVSVIALKSNMRGTPSAQGIVVTELVKGDTGIVIKKEDVWYLVQTSKYVGWVHGNNIRIINANNTQPIEPTTPKALPPGTYIPEDENSPFQSEYVGADRMPVITVENKTAKIMNLTFGGVKYVIDAWGTQTITADGGAYDFTASATGVRTLKGMKRFDRGYRYSWTFILVTTPR